MTITEFLLARIAEDEAWVIRSDCECGEGWPRLPSCPDRVLAECEAKRGILAEHPITDKVVGYGGGKHLFGCETCHDWDGVTEGHGYCPTLRYLAAPHSDHPDYDAGWAL